MSSRLAKQREAEGEISEYHRTRAARYREQVSPLVRHSRHFHSHIAPAHAARIPCSIPSPTTVSFLSDEHYAPG